MGAAGGFDFGELRRLPIGTTEPPELPRRAGGLHLSSIARVTGAQKAVPTAADQCNGPKLQKYAHRQLDCLGTSYCEHLHLPGLSFYVLTLPGLEQQSIRWIAS